MELKKIGICQVGKTNDLVRRTSEIFYEELTARSGLEIELGVNSQQFQEYDCIFIIGIDEDLIREFPKEKEAIATLEVPGPEGYRIVRKKNRVFIAGRDARGCLYGMARVLRKTALKPGYAEITDELVNISITPSSPLRGHQLAYRDKQNTCPGWDLDDFDRYIRDLAFFGTNAIEILPPRSDDRLYSPKFKKDPLEMMVELSRLIHGYGMDVWVWYPNMGEDYSNPVTREKEMMEREEIYSKVPYIDAVLIPAGDPGELEPKELFPVAEESSRILHRYHPNAKVWIAPQVFAPRVGWHEEFYQELSKEPEWLYGVCYAPWMYETIQQFHEAVPAKYKNRIRHYPDITHNSSSQFEVPGWDLPFALLNGRESYNARPKAMKAIHNYHAKYTIGSITYSEGIHDDINKMIWGDQDFIFDFPVEETLRDYARLFISPDYVDSLVPLFLRFEENWVGYAKENQGIDEVYKNFTELFNCAPAQIQNNYRFKMGYLRALTDYYAKHRSIADKALEDEAYEVLARADESDPDKSIHEAWGVLNRTFSEPSCEDLMHEMQRLADELNNTPHCRIQLNTLNHLGQKWIRGAYLDVANMPLNDHQFLTEHFRRVLELKTNHEKMKYIDWIVNRTNPGTGGFYACLGDLNDFDRYVKSSVAWENDPGFLRSPVINSDPYGLMMVFHHNRGWHGEYPISMNWIKRARVLYGTPLKVRFEGLDSDSLYKLRITYPDALLTHRPEEFQIKLIANGHLIHDVIQVGKDCEYPVFEYEFDHGLISDGVLDLVWQKWGTLDRVSVSEVMLVKVEG